MTQCTAKAKRTGEQCKAQSISGHKKCRVHGGMAGKASKGKKFAAKPGSLYSQYLDADTKKDYDDALISINSLDNELALAKAQLAKVLRIRQQNIEHNQMLEQESEDKYVADEHGNLVLAERKIKTKRTDYDELIIRYTGRIESILKTQRDLSKTDTDSNDLKIVITGGLAHHDQNDDDNGGVTIIEPSGYK